MHAGNHPPSEMTVKARKFRGLNFFRNSSLKFQKSGVLTTASLKGKKQTVPGEAYGWIRTERKKSGKPPTWLLTSKSVAKKRLSILWQLMTPSSTPLPWVSSSGKARMGLSISNTTWRENRASWVELGYSLCWTWICRPGNTRRKIAQI